MSAEPPNTDPTAPPPPLPGTRKALGATPLVGVLAVVLTLVLVAVMIRHGQALVGQDTSPAQAAVRFLQAVADGDAEAALAAQRQVPADRFLLTDEVLARSQRLAPISRIRVLRETPEEVEVSYLLGEREVQANFVPVRQDDGGYRIERGTTPVRISTPEQLDVFINGVRLSSDTVQAFPGAYEVSTGLRTIEYLDPRFTVSGPESAPRLAPGPQLSPHGTSLFLAATRTRLDECLLAKEVNPPGCPQLLTITEGVRVDPDSVEWTLEEDPLTSVTPKLSLNDETVAELPLSVRARLRARALTHSGPGTVDQTETFSTLATAPVTVEPITVRFVRG